MSSLKVTKFKRFLYDVVKYSGYFPWMPDSWYLKLMFREKMKKKLNLAHPQTFNEKLQWLKLYDRRPEYTDMVDKYRVRQIVADKIGEEYLIPLLGVWDSFDEIDFSKLPDRFVLKCNHDNASVFICKDRNKLDPATIRTKFIKALRRDFYRPGREWPYKNVVRKIIAEQYLVDQSGSGLADYKILCFNGTPKLIQVHTGRFTEEHYQNWYDTDWKKLKINQVGSVSSSDVVEKPSFLNEALDLSEKLSVGIPHVRVDWYFANQRLYFGELTFFDSSGFSRLEPEEFEERLGSWITLPTSKKTNV